MIKKLFLASFLFLFLTPSFTQAAGLVPCGGEGQKGCEFCDFFVLINNLVRFVMFTIVPAVAVLMMIIAGVMFFFAGAEPGALNKAKGAILGVAIGLLLIFSAWIIVNTILSQFGIVDSSLLNWYKPSCPAR